MNEAVENAGSQQEGAVVGIPEGYTPDAEMTGAPKQDNPPEQKPPEPALPEAAQIVEKLQLQDGQWLVKEGILGSGDRPDWLLEKYGYNVESQAKAGPDAQKKIGEQAQRLGAFTGAPDKYDFSTIEDESFKFDEQDTTFNQFVTECQNNNVNQEFAVKIAGFAKELINEPKVNKEEEIKAYGESFKEDEKNIKNWVSNNSSGKDAKELLDSIKTAGAVRALKNLMEVNGVEVPAGTATGMQIPKETISDVKKSFAANLYEGEKIADHPEKIQPYIDKLKKHHGQ